VRRDCRLAFSFGFSFVGLAGFEPAASATQNCYEPRTRMLALH
jgi:hypothetical protein